MRRYVWFTFIFLLLFSTVTLSGGQDKHMNLWLTIGGSTSQFDDALVDVGFELQLTRILYFQIVANSHMGNERYGYPYYNNYPYGYTYNQNYYYYGGSQSVNIGFSAGGLHGFTAYGMFKVPLSNRISLFTKGGVFMAFYDEYRYFSEDASYSEDSTTGFGVAAGGGLTYSLTEKVGLLGGVTYKYLFNDSASSIESDNIDWFKFYVGISYGFK